MDKLELCKAAISAQKNSYSTYSGYRVGAALITKSGKIYSGCNIEISSYSATVCAERTAYFKAVSEGEYEFSAIAIAGGKAGEINPKFTPCGVCRQVMAEFCDKDFTVLVVKPNGYNEYTLNDLFPNSFALGE